MKKQLLLIAIIVMSSLVAQATIHTIVNAGFTFSPNSLTINEGDSVNFVLAGAHNSVEVSQSTWSSNGNTALAGGWQTSFGGGLVLPAKLTVGMHYYVCAPHAGSGMKGTIEVLSTSGITEAASAVNLRVFPNPATTRINIKADAKFLQRTYTITDRSGRMIANGILEGETTPVDLSGFAAGYYFLRYEDQTVTFQVISRD